MSPNYAISQPRSGVWLQHHREISYHFQWILILHKSIYRDRRYNKVVMLISFFNFRPPPSDVINAIFLYRLYSTKGILLNVSLRYLFSDKFKLLYALFFLICNKTSLTKPIANRVRNVNLFKKDILRFRLPYDKSRRNGSKILFNDDFNCASTWHLKWCMCL